MLPYWRLSAYYFFHFAFIGAFAPYFSLYLQSLAFAAWEIGIVMSIMPVMRLIAPYAWSYLAERLSAQLLVVRLSAALSAAGFGGLFFASSFGGVFAGMTVLSAFWSAALPLVESLTLRHLDERPADYGSIRLWGSVGFIAAVLGVGYILDHSSLSALLWVSMGLLVAILLCALAVPDAAGRPHESDRHGIGRILRRPEVVALLAACFFMSAAHGALYVFLSIHLVEHGYSKSAVGWLWTLGVFVEIGVFMFQARMMHRYSLLGILRFSFACAALRFALIGWSADLLAVVVFAQLLHGATYGAYHAAAVGAVNRWFPGRHQAQGQALYSSVSFGAGGMVGGVLAGWSWEAIGPSLTFTLSSALAAIGLLLLFRWGGALSAPARGAR